jgi:tRNA uridine 5-carboxymethylaminomethyl modification enzyme
MQMPKVKEYADSFLFEEEEIEQVEIKIKYEGYIQKEKENAEKLKKHENINIPIGFDYSKLQSLSFEAREKLNKIRPQTIGQAKRISGISPSDVSILLIYMGR